VQLEDDHNRHMAMKIGVTHFNDGR